MAYYMIATLRIGSNVIGIRLFDSSAKAQQTKVMDVKVENIKAVLLSKKAEIVNLELDNNGELQGVNGIIDRYTKLALPSLAVTGKTPLTVLNAMCTDDTGTCVGYEVVDYQGKVRKLKTEDVIKLVKQNGISNGKIVSREGIEDYIQPIIGTYPVQKITRSKIGGAKLDIRIGMPTGNQGGSELIRNTKAEVAQEVQSNDVFMALNSTQRKAIKDYYLWYTVDAFYKLAKGIRLNVPASKVEKLAELRGETRWVFAGIEDKYFMGGAHCELGHALRYAYYAAPEDEQDNPDARIIFGETCSGDFFDISPEDMKKLIKVRTSMSEEIKLLATIVTNHQENEYIEKLDVLYHTVDTLKSQGDLELVFGDKVSSALKAFLIAKLPFPQSLVKLCTKQIASFGIEKFYTKLFKSSNPSVVLKIFNTSSKNEYLNGVKEYLMFIATNKIEGGYAYDPYDEEKRHRDEGAYNKQTRLARSRELQKLRRRTCGTKFSWDEIHTIYQTAVVLEERSPVVLQKLANMNEKPEEIIGYLNRYLRSVSNYSIRVDYLDDLNAVRSALLYARVNDSIVRYGYDVVAKLSSTGFIQNYRDADSLLKNVSRLKGDIIIDRGIEEILRVVNSQRNLESERTRMVAEAARKEQEERKKAVEEAQQKERERQASIKEMQRIAELDRAAREAKKAERKAAKGESKEEIPDGEELITALKDLIGTTASPSDPYGVKVSKSILSRNQPWWELSKSQRWRLRQTYTEVTKESKTQKSQGEAQVSSTQPTSAESASILDDTNNAYLLGEHPEIESDIDLIIEAYNTRDPKLDDVYKATRYAVKIAFYIKKYRKASDKQLKHIKKAVEILRVTGDK